MCRIKSFNILFLSVGDESMHIQFKRASAPEKRLAAMAAFGWTAEECMVKRQGEQEATRRAGAHTAGCASDLRKWPCEAASHCAVDKLAQQILQQVFTK
jgi:hypothetical protein